MKYIILTAIIIIGAIGYIEKILKFQMPRRYIIILFLLFLLFSLAQLKLSVDSDGEISSLKSTIAKSDEELSKLREDSTSRDKEIVSLKKDLEVSKNNLSETKNRLSDILTYGEVATWTLDGSKSIGGGGVAVSSPVSGWLKIISQRIEVEFSGNVIQGQQNTIKV